MKIFTQNKKRIDFETCIFALLIASLIALLALRDIFALNINKYIFLGVFIICASFLSLDRLILSFCFMIPLFNGLPGNYIMLSWLILYVVRKRKINIKIILPFGFFAILEFVSAICVNESSLISIIGYLMCLLAFLTLLLDENLFLKENALKLYLFGTLAYSLLIFFSTIITAPSNWLDLFARGLYRFGDLVETDSMHIRSNPNELAYYCIVGFSVGLLLLKNNLMKNTASKVAVFVSTIFILIVGALSTSRSYILVFVIILFAFLIINLKSFKFTICFFLTILLLAVGFSFLIGNNYSLIEGFATRFSFKNVSTAGGRFELWTQYWSAFFSNARFVLIGEGVVSYKEATGLYAATHNMFQQIVMCYGLFGTIVFLYILIFSIAKQKIASLNNLLPLFAVLLFTQTIQFLNPWNLMLPFIIGIYALELNKGCKNNTN